jgi:subtilisin family serine protease
VNEALGRGFTSERAILQSSSARVRLPAEVPLLSGYSGPHPSIGGPARVLDNGDDTIGDIVGSSSRGPTGDGRMKPTIVATGATIRSARAGTTSDYRDDSGCSMATPHVSGIAATVMEHYPSSIRSSTTLRPGSTA